MTHMLDAIQSPPKETCRHVCSSLAEITRVMFSQTHWCKECVVWLLPSSVCIIYTIVHRCCKPPWKTATPYFCKRETWSDVVCSETTTVVEIIGILVDVNKYAENIVSCIHLCLSSGLTYLASPTWPHLFRVRFWINFYEYMICILLLKVEESGKVHYLYSETTNTKYWYLLSTFFTSFTARYMGLIAQHVRT